MNTYQMSHLEDFVKGLYTSIGIEKPSQLNIFEITYKLNIWLYYSNSNSRALNRNGLYSINIDQRVSKERQWEDFGHELAHLLRDAGNQLRLPDHMIHYQEAKADVFALELCVPTFMLLDISLPIIRNEAVNLIVETFNVSPVSAEKKLSRFENRKFQSIKEATSQYLQYYEQEIISKYGGNHIERLDDQVLILSIDGNLVKVLYDYGHNKMDYSTSFLNKYKNRRNKHLYKTIKKKRD